MKLIHTADLHLGMHPDKGMPWSGERSEALWEALRRIIRHANTEQTDLLLIAGDLFHRQPLLRELKEVNALFETLDTAQVVLIAGNHDCITPHSHYRDFEWAENVTFLTGSWMESIYFRELNTEVHGFSYHQPEYRESLYDRLQAPSDGRIHILLGHGGDEKHIPIDRSRLAAAGFHYAALGHIHKPELQEGLRLAWCGSPEPVDRTDIGSRGYVTAEITLHQTRLRFVPDCTAQYIPLTVTVTPDTTREGLSCSLSRTIQKKGMQNLYLVTLQGERAADLDLSAAVPLKGNLVQWSDRTHMALDYNRLLAEHSGDLLGQFLAEMEKVPYGPLREKALAYGVQACLREGGRL